MTTKKYPDWICNTCGIAYGKWYVDGNYAGPKHHCATFHIGTCDCCGKTPIPVTEPRDYGHLRDWPEEPSTPASLGELVIHVLNDFPFEKVHNVMKTIDWKWMNKDGSLEVPSVSRMHDCAKKLIKTVISERKDSGYLCVGTGGFFAEADEDGVSLRFVLAESESLFSDFE